MQSQQDNIADFNTNGFAIFENIIHGEQLVNLSTFLEKNLSTKTSAGQRNLLALPEIKSFASSGTIVDIAAKILDTKPLPVRAILFDKTPQSNWYVTWHQDLTIPVMDKIETEGFSSWSVKDGIVHVQPPAVILEKMVSLRIHLDPCGESNGPIKYLGGSHLGGVLDQAAIATWREREPAITCTANPGDIIAMRPLILHSSSVSQSPERRRVLHLEYSGTPLPAGLTWGQA